MTVQQLQAEAQMIADANGGSIVYMSDDATFFQVRHVVGTLVDGIEAESDGTTNFELVEDRFEGFVSIR